MRRVLYLLAAGFAGWGFALAGVPAGWLIGSLLVGMAYRLGVGELRFPPYFFAFAIALIGTSVGMTMRLSLFQALASYLLPLGASLVAVLLGAWLLSRWLSHHGGVDAKTALFCCVPGGLSVMLPLSQEYGADQRMVAAFQLGRAILIVLAIPIFAGIVVSATGAGAAHGAAQAIASAGPQAGPAPDIRVLYALGVVAVALFLARVAKIPAAPFLYALLVAFVLNQFIIHVGVLPKLALGLGQALLGAIVGLQFDRGSVRQLRRLGWVSAGVLAMYLGLTLAISLIFFWLTPLDFVTSMLGMAPGGAPQMASTAALLDLDASTVAAVQLVRLVCVFLLLPIAIPILMKRAYRAKEG